MNSVKELQEESDAVPDPGCGMLGKMAEPVAPSLAKGDAKGTARERVMLRVVFGVLVSYGRVGFLPQNASAVAWSHSA